MKCWMVRISLCLILGAITTVAVAWGSAMAFKRPSGRTFTADRPSAWPVPVPDHWPDSPDEEHHAGLFWQWSMFDAILLQPDGSSQYFLIERLFFGWPRRSMRTEFWEENVSIRGSFQDATAGHPAPSIWREGIPTKMGFSVLPLNPVWPGFVIDTLFYAAIWFGVFFGFTSAKRAMRRRRGRCPMCGYDLRGDFAAGCSECGCGRDSRTSSPKG